MKRLFIIVFVVVCQLLPAQNQRIFRTLTVKDGLSQSEVSGMTQDKDGFMWFSTNFGLNKFDGYTIWVYNQDKEGIYQMPYYSFHDVQTDVNGNLYVAGDNLMKYDWEKNIFVIIPNLPKVKEIHTDPKGSVWFISLNYSDACCIDKNAKNFRQFTHDPNNNRSVKGKIVTAMNIDKKNRLWLAFDDVDYVSCLKLDDYYKNDKKAEFTSYPVSGNKITAVYNVQDNVRFADKQGYVYRYDETQDKMELLTDAFAGHSITAGVEDKNGNVWIATTNQGLLLWNPKSKMRFNYNTVNSNLASNFITRLFVDNTGVLWMATGQGIAYTDTYAKMFNTYRYIPGYSKSLPEKSVKGVGCDDKGILWVSTEKGIVLINEKTDEVKNQSIFPEGVQRALTNMKLTSIIPYQESNMLGAGRGVNILSFDQKGVEYSVPESKDSIAPDKWICNTVHYGKRTNFYWIGTQNAGLFCISDPSYASVPFGSVTRMPEKIVRYSWITEISRESVSAIYEDNDGILWIGSSCGLVAYNTNDNSSELYLNDPKDPNSLSHNSVKCLLQDSRGFIWVGTEAAGINKFSKKTKKFQRYTTADELCNNNITGILEDKNYRLWISTRNGLSCFEPLKNTFKTYNYSDGLPSNEFNYLSFCRTKDGRFCFGTVDGLTVFNPDSIHDNPIPPKTVITNLYIYNKIVRVGEKVRGSVILDKPIQYEDKIELSDFLGQNKVVSIEFAAIHYASPEMTEYSYQLEGIDHDFRKTSAINRVAHYTNLSPGTYIFKVKSCNLDGVWDEKGTSLIIKVIPPFWKTWWFRIFMLISLIAGVFLIFWGRIKQVEYQKRKLQEQVDKQTEEIRQKAEILKQVNDQLVDQQKELQETNVQLEERHEEINAQKEELAHQADELRKANATKDKFFSIIGHDLRNPMYAINSLSKMLKDGGADMDKEQLKEMYVMLEQSSEGVTMLLENLLTWARAQSGRVDYKPESIDLSQVAISTNQVLKMNAENKGLKLASEVPAGTMVYADKNMITTVIRNLINNAIKFTSKGGITVRCYDFEGMKKVSIDDTGVGMNDEAKNKLFRIDVHHTTQGTSGEAGTGLGLIICKEFVEINKGKIWVESELNKGSSFIFTLPLTMK